PCPCALAAQASVDGGARMALDLNEAPPGAALGAERGDGVAEAPSVALPPLREDLKLMPGPAGGDGSPTWTLHDPARHRFIRIGWLEFEVLARWALGNTEAVARSISTETTIRATSQDVLE